MEGTKILSKTSFVAVSVFSFISLIFSCVERTSRNPDRKNSSDSVVTSIEGISTDDKSRTFTYLLTCDGMKDPITGQLGGPTDSKQTIEFKNVPAGDQKNCFVRIDGPYPSDDELKEYDFRWLSKTQPTPGKPASYYQSTKADITAANRMLYLTIYKIYERSKKGAPKFQADLNVELFENNNTPITNSVGEALVEIQCEGQLTTTTDKITFSSDKKHAAVVSFSLEIEKFKGKACQRLRVVPRDFAYEWVGQLSSVTFDAAVKPDQKVAFGPFALGKVVGSNSVIVVPGSRCFNFDVAAGKCNDNRAAVTLPYAKKFWFATVRGMNKAGEGREYIVAGSQGFALDTKNSISVALLQEALSKKGEGFTFYDSRLRLDIMSKPFNESFVKNEFVKPEYKITVDQLDGFEFLDLREAWVRGFYQVITPDQHNSFNAQTSARWFNTVRASAGGVSQEFVVAGSGMNFLSSERRAGSIAAPKFYDWETFRKEHFTTSVELNGPRFTLYAIEPQPDPNRKLAPNCKLTKENLFESFSQRHETQLAAAIPASEFPGGNLGTLDDCKVASPLTIDDSWSRSESLFALGWYKL